MSKKMKVFLIKKNRLIKIAKASVKENKAIIGKDEYLFEPDSIFFVKKGFLGLTGYEPAIIVQEGKLTAEKMIGNSELITLTNMEIKEIVKREIAKSVSTTKPIKLSYFLILAGLIVINILITLLIMKGVRI